MAFEFRLPDIGEGLAEAEVVAWLVEEGQEVGLDQALVQIETDKAVTDIPSPRAGMVLRHGAAEGEVIRVGEVLAVIGVAGEAPAAVAGSDAAPVVGTLLEAETVEAPPPEAPARPARAGGPAGPVALPVVRKLARDLGVDVASVRGTGPGGRVTRQDVEAAAGAGPAEERVRMSKLRRTVAERLSRSWREIPHVTTFGDVEATALLEARRSLAGRGGPVPLEALFVAACLPALREHAAFNAAVDGDDLILKRHYDIGVAVDTPDGLVVGVVRGADRLGLPDLGAEIARLAGAVRDRSATTAELSGATFTVSNIGAVGGGHGTPIIPFGTTAILSFGRIEDRPVVRSGRVEAAPVLPLSLSYDHRAIDGALGRRFLAAVTDALARPETFRNGQIGGAP